MHRTLLERPRTFKCNEKEKRADFDEKLERGPKNK